MSNTDLIQQRVQLPPYNSFGVEAIADYFASIRSVEDLREALDFADRNGQSVQILGGGSNVLFINDYPGLVCRMELRGISRRAEPGMVQAGCGENWHGFVTYCLKNSLHGYENLALIPGTVGAAPIQNIGAYGVELQQFFVELEALDRDSGALRKFSRDECEFAYRDSLFKQQASRRYVVLSVSFQLSAHAPANTDYQALRESLPAGNASPQQIYDTVCQIRRAKLPDPAELGNAGSFFKNPIVSQEKYEVLQSEHGQVPVYTTEEEGFVKIPAAWLLDVAGWKGRSRGHAAVHNEHALVLVNPGHACGEDILLLAQEMSSSILSRFGIGLVPEVQII